MSRSLMVDRISKYIQRYSRYVFPRSSEVTVPASVAATGLPLHEALLLAFEGSLFPTLTAARRACRNKGGPWRCDVPRPGAGQDLNACWRLDVLSALLGRL